jgi:hypothetical protein
MKQKRILFIVIAILLVIIIGTLVWYGAYDQKNKNIDSYDECAAAGYPVLGSFPQKCSVPSGKSFTQATDIQTPLSLEGETVCLPHKDVNGPHTMECAMGLKTDTGKYYGLGTDPYDTSLSVTNRRVKVSGTLKPCVDSKYQSEGTITVTKYEFLD